MKTRSVFFLSFFAALMFCLSPTMAEAKPKKIGQYKDWSAYTYHENGGKVCFMVSKPKSAKGNYSRRGDIYALVTHRTSNNSRDVVSFVTGYTYKEDSEVDVSIGSKKFTLFTKDDTAWTKSALEDTHLTKAIKDESRMVVKGRSARGTLTTDTYSLRGSTAAYNAINSACK